VVQIAGPEEGAIARIDFAHVVKKQLLIYGWIWDFAKSVDTALLYLGGNVIDLVKQAIRVRRPDVTRHFPIGIGHDDHGFYALVDLPESVASIDYLRLSITLVSGKTTESRWPVASHTAVTAAVLQPCVTTLNGLMRYLPRLEAKRLVEFAAPALWLDMGAEHLAALLQPIRFEIDLCCVLENNILVVFGWLFDPANELTVAQLRIGASVFDLLENSLWIARPDVNPEPSLYQKSPSSRLPGFVFVQRIPQPEQEGAEVRFVLAAGAEPVRFSRPVSSAPSDARRDFLALLSKMDPDSALAFNERVAVLLDNSPAQRSLHALLELNHHRTVERLPPSLQHANPRYSLFVDQAIPVAGKGVFLIGWFNAGPSDSVQVVCQSGHSSYVISDNWLRHLRADVTSHLSRAGIQLTDHEHGYSCYVPLRDGDAPYYLSIISESGEARSMRVTVAEKAESALQTVRALLMSFNCERGDMRVLLERHVGPAVQAAWAARHKPVRKSVVSNFGVAPRDPVVSIIVPLFGRHDLAEYQMAQFAGDPEFQDLELIYVVDDPAIFDEFRNLCSDLYGIYQVPFVLAFPGANLGFAGANNFGAEIARGQYLFLMNSDVMPKRTGWVGELLRVYRSLDTPGLLGTKLLYEDGSVQHAGIAFKRHAAWGGLWINDHPFKGQSPLGLSGVPGVDAVTAAAALIETKLFRELGGFSEDYIIGDFEDSDLCLRASSAGRRNHVALDIELYHLERQSQNRTGDAMWRTNLTAYNCWLHNSRWADRIERSSVVMASGGR
jgi:GT2 family glycosyltransferase